MSKKIELINKNSNTNKNTVIMKNNNIKNNKKINKKVIKIISYQLTYLDNFNKYI